MKTNWISPIVIGVVVGMLATGCGMNASAPKPNAQQASGATDQQAEPAETLKEPEINDAEDSADKVSKDGDVYLKKEHYEGSMIQPEQIDLLNQLFRAQNAGDAQAYASLFTQDASKTDKQISFKVDQAKHFDLFAYDADTTGVYPLGGAIRENAADGYHSILYILKQEAGQWRIAEIEHANGPYVDEEQYDGDELEILKLINASTKARNAGDAEAYRKLFIENSNVGGLREDAPGIEEVQLMNFQPPSADTAIVPVHYRVEGESSVRSNSYAFVRQEGKWMIYDID